MKSDKPDLRELREIFKRLERRMAEIKKMDNDRVMSYTDEKSIQDKIEQFLDYIDEITSLWNKIATSLTDKVVDTKTFQKQAGQHRVIAIPLKLTLFSGDPLEWLSFWVNFSSAIDDNRELTDVDKMNYLSGLLKGEAARAVSSLPLTVHNYQVAVLRFSE